MRLDILIQFIVPLTFLAIWALTSILNRDAQPLPPRPGRPVGPGGQRPPARLPGQFDPRPAQPVQEPRPPATSPFAERPSGLIGSGISPAAQTPPLARTRPRPLTNMDDAIIYIENDPAGRPARTAARPSPGGAGPQPQSRPPRIAPQRRGARGRAPAGTASTAQGRSEPEPQRVLSEQLSQSLALQKTKPLEITPLATPIAPLARPAAGVSATLQSSVRPLSSPGPAVTSAAIRRLLASPAQLREIAVLSEILQPPLALRARRPRH